MVVAPITAGRESGLRALLDTMNAQPGIADPRNALLPFGEFEYLHFARWVILEDATQGDIAVHGLPVPSYPKYLVFMGDCDGPSRDFLTDFAQRAERGLRKIYAHCEGFDERSDVLAWLLDHDVPVAASYVNWLGRTVRQVKEERALQRALVQVQTYIGDAQVRLDGSGAVNVQIDVERIPKQ